MGITGCLTIRYNSGNDAHSNNSITIQRFCEKIIHCKTMINHIICQAEEYKRQSAEIMY